MARSAESRGSERGVKGAIARHMVRLRPARARPPPAGGSAAPTRFGCPPLLSQLLVFFPPTAARAASPVPAVERSGGAPAFVPHADRTPRLVLSPPAALRHVPLARRGGQAAGAQQRKGGAPTYPALAAEGGALAAVGNGKEPAWLTAQPALLSEVKGVVGETPEGAGDPFGGAGAAALALPGASRWTDPLTYTI